MAYSYPQVFNILTLQLKGLESLLAETRQAILTLEHIRYLLERHQQTALRLGEVSARLNALDHRMIEIAENQQVLDQRSQNNSRSSGIPLGKALYLQNRKNALSQSQVVNGSSTPPADLPPPVSKDQLNLAQLELMNVQNQHATQENRRHELENELKELEAELTALGFKGGFI